MVMETPINCGTCTACCETAQIVIRPEHGDDPSKYVLVIEDGQMKIAPRQDGSKACYYLGDNGEGCTIYEDRPVACRAFDCRAYLKNMKVLYKPEERLKMIRQHPNLKKIFDAARKRA
jgi:Fe-S-cluster containining protein